MEEYSKFIIVRGITAIKLKAIPEDLVIIQVNVPTGQHSDQEVENMCEQIDPIIDAIKRKYTICYNNSRKFSRNRMYNNETYTG